MLNEKLQMIYSEPRGKEIRELRILLTNACMSYHSLTDILTQWFTTSIYPGDRIFSDQTVKLFN